MKSLLIPNLYVDSIFDIDLQKLVDNGIKGLIIDIDNTLVAWDKKTAPDSVIKWFDEIREKGLDLCLVSNNTEDRVVKFTEKIKIRAFHSAKKPTKAPFYKAMKYLNTDKNNTAIIGDQIFTDVLGGNRIGIYTILVVPIKSKEFWWTTIVRRFERFVLRKIKKGEN
ncbi:YqeG family HAD IIIA-type phosphatase [Clostridium sp. D2Q-14]|uniref:YqeG family HAD IIIA-type phosphatase n=1 Tax=Anaeromonas gelatinilytica TaxID=2683194 RepID=UPI00193C63B3|nr:YqeG family HAD IIIA-type phosphatase [Anaeromonas gelatinilytica]MBS4536180.1 YqeG family HAD IIIA-type phosphatase [Anaeromonas gelatinilytica]